MRFSEWAGAGGRRGWGGIKEQGTNLVGRVAGKLRCCDPYRSCLPGTVRARLAVCIWKPVGGQTAAVPVVTGGLGGANRQILRHR
jgi:hypothetical protein